MSSTIAIGALFGIGVSLMSAAFYLVGFYVGHRDGYQAGMGDSRE